MFSLVVRRQLFERAEEPAQPSTVLEDVVRVVFCSQKPFGPFDDERIEYVIGLSFDPLTT